MDVLHGIANSPEYQRKHAAKMAGLERKKQELYRQRRLRDMQSEAGIMTPSLRKQLRQWSKQLGGDRANDGIKLVFKPNQGYSDIFFGGIGSPDGPGHGHIRITVDGVETIIRQPYIKGKPGARKDATLLDSKTPDRRKKS